MEPVANSQSGRELFSRAHYNVIAKRIRNTRHRYTTSPVTQVALDDLVLEFADWFEKDNPRFDRDQWFGATN